MFAGLFAPGVAPSWKDLADAAERLRLEGERRLSTEGVLGAAARRMVDRRSPKRKP